MSNEQSGSQGSPWIPDDMHSQETVSPQEAWERAKEAKLAEALQELREMGEVGWWDRTADLANAIVAFATQEKVNMIKLINDRAKRVNYQTNRLEIDYNDPDRRDMLDIVNGTFEELSGLSPAEASQEWQEQRQRRGRAPRQVVSKAYKGPFGQGWGGVQIIGRLEENMFTMSGQSDGGKMLFERTQAFIPSYILEQIVPLLSPDQKRALELVGLTGELDDRMRLVVSGERDMMSLRDQSERRQREIQQTSEQMVRLGIDPANPQLFPSGEPQQSSSV